MQRKLKTNIMYRKFPSGVIGALFIIRGINNFIEPVKMYQLGAFSDVDYARTVMTTIPAKLNEYTSLHKDLINQGFNITVIKKRDKR